MKIILTVLGHDKVGIIARISQELYKNNINILDVNQTIIDGYFTMIMLLDFTMGKKSFDEIKNDLNSLAADIEVQINIQRQEIFDAMHKL